MTKFVIGGETASRKARELPEGTPVRVSEVRDVDSNFERTIRSGPRKGEKEKITQLLVVYEVLEDVDECEDGDPAEAGEDFAQYYGGVYRRDDGNIFLTEAGGANGFVVRMTEAGIESDGTFEPYEGIEGTIEHEKGRGPKGPYVLAFIDPDGEAKPKKAAKKGKAKKGKAKKAAKKTKGRNARAKKNAFTALSDDDQEAVIEAVEEGLDNPDALMAADIATDEEHAEEILANVPRD